MKIENLALSLVAFSLLAMFSVACATEKRKGPLADRPSKPGVHLAKVKALGANTWLNLGKPRPDPKYGAAQGRSYSRKMAFAPDLRGAFIWGEGVHGGNIKRGDKRYYNDDLYFYDINAHAWVCCYPGTPLVNPGIKLDPKTGFETDTEGNVIPVAPSTHAYWCPEYDIDRKMFMFMPSPGTPYWKKALGKHRPHIFPNGKANYRLTPGRKPGSPYYFDPVGTGRWERRKTAGGGKSPPCNVDNALFYSRKLKKPVYMLGGTWLYDYKTNQWQKVSKTGGGNAAYCHDSKRDVIYRVNSKSIRGPKGHWIPVPNSNRLSIYDIAANKWTKPATAGDPGECATSHLAFFTYDTTNDVAVLHVNNKHHVYDPEKKKWRVMPVSAPAEHKTRGFRWSSGFYDEKLGVHFYFNAGDSSRKPGNMWVYRYKRAGKS